MRIWCVIVNVQIFFLFVAVLCTDYFVGVTHAVTTEEENPSVNKPEPNKVFPPTTKNDDKVSHRPSDIMIHLKHQLQTTKHILNDMFLRASMMFTPRDKDNNAIATIHRSVSDKPIPPVTAKTPDEVRLDELYQVAIKLLSSSDKNKQAAYKLLHESSNLGHIPSKLKMAMEILIGNLNQDLENAKRIFVELADIGEPDAHVAMGFLYSAGITERSDQARALIHYMLGALGGNVWAQIILGYRYKFGITVTMNCEKSLLFYELAAKAVAQHLSVSGDSIVHRIRLNDLEESGGFNRYWIETDVLQFYEYLAAKGDLNAQVSLGKLYYHGLRGCPKDLAKADLYFRLAVEKGSATSMAYLGKIYLEDSGYIRANNSAAYTFFKLAAAKNNPIGWSGLGLMYLEGKGVDLDLLKAKLAFTKAADKGWVEGQLHLGVMYLNGLGVPKDYRMAFKYFHLAAQNGHVLAYYHLAQMHATGIGILRSCSTAVELYKNVVEHGKWNEYFVLGNNNFLSGNYFQAFVLYALLSEFGYEVAQINAAYLLEKGLSGLTNVTDHEKYTRAFTYWRRAAQQGYSPAYVKLGDYYYYGQGVDLDYEVAVNQYRLASNQLGNAQALFNIGYMHEKGLGISRDLVLAKRFYDLAASISPDAVIPVYFALFKLAGIMYLDYFMDLISNFYLHLSTLLFTQWDIFLLMALTVLLRFLHYRRIA